MAAAANTAVMEIAGGHQLHVLVFESVTNAADVCQWVRQPAADFAAMDARAILHPVQLAAAALQAVHAAANGKLATHHVHSEIVYAVSASKQINDAFRRFGASESSTRLVLATFEGQAADRLRERVHGTQVDVATLSSACDEALVRKLYKVSEAETRVGPLLDAIVTRIALTRL